MALAETKRLTLRCLLLLSFCTCNCQYVHARFGLIVVADKRIVTGVGRRKLADSRNDTCRLICSFPTCSVRSQRGVAVVSFISFSFFFTGEFGVLTVGF